MIRTSGKKKSAPSTTSLYPQQLWHIFDGSSHGWKKQISNPRKMAASLALSSSPTTKFPLPSCSSLLPPLSLSTISPKKRATCFKIHAQLGNVYVYMCVCVCVCVCVYSPTDQFFVFAMRVLLWSFGQGILRWLFWVGVVFNGFRWWRWRSPEGREEEIYH